MITANERNGNVRGSQASELGREEKSRRVVLPVAVEDIAGQEKKSRLFVEAKIDQVRERAAGRRADGAQVRGFVAREASERAVEVQIRCMHEPHAAMK